MTLKNFKFKRVVFFLFSLSFLFLSHCLAANYNSVLLFPSVGEETSLPDSTYFYFDLDESHYDRLGVDVPLYEISTTEHYGDAQDRDSVSNCEVEYNSDDGDPEDNFSENKICILDIMEYDLVVNDLRIVYNIPEGMCRYVRTTPPWHYNYKTGFGPVFVAECEPPEVDGDEEQTEEPVFCAENYPVGSLGGELKSRSYGDYECKGGIAQNSTTAKCAKEVEDLCAYNYQLDGETISCCYGNYSLSDGSREEWGGSDGLSQCLGGPGRTSWEHLDDKGFPARLIEHVSEFGVRGAFEVKNLLDATDGRPYWSTPTANYLEALDKDPEDLREVSRASSSNGLPEFLQPPTATIGPDENQVTISLPAPNLFFDVECLDSGGEVLHKLQLMVREWNTHEEFIEFYDSGGSEGPDPDIVGEEGEDCDYEERGVLKGEAQLCNDSMDFYDIEERTDLFEEFFERIFGARFSTIKFPRATYGGSGN